jgi:hypothetical protein
MNDLDKSSVNDGHVVVENSLGDTVSLLLISNNGSFSIFLVIFDNIRQNCAVILEKEYTPYIVEYH